MTIASTQKAFFFGLAFGSTYSATSSVPIPRIERNARGWVKAIKAPRMAMRGDGKHRVSLDKVTRILRDTGRGGLAVNVIEC